MKNLIVLFIDTDINRDPNFAYGMHKNNIVTHELSMFDIEYCNFKDIDCIVYGYRLYKDKDLLCKIPPCIPRVIWTATPESFKKDEYKISETTGLRILIGEKFDTTDPVVQKFGDTDSLKGLPEYPNNFICRPEVIVLANKIRSVCEEN